MEFYYLQISSGKKPSFVKHYEKLGLTINGLRKEEIPFALEQRMLTQEIAFLPFETSEDKTEWIRIAKEVEKLGIKKAFSSSEVLSKFLEEKEVFPEPMKIDKGEEGYIFLLYSFCPHKRKLGGVFSTHKKLTKRSPLKILSKKEENVLESFIEELSEKHAFRGFVNFRFQRNENSISLLQIDPLPDLSSPDKEAIKIANAFGFSYESLLNMLLKAIE